nr:MAG TPA: hypothetical protein [Caudoviricetes sp.]
MRYNAIKYIFLIVIKVKSRSLVRSKISYI